MDRENIAPFNTKNIVWTDPEDITRLLMNFEYERVYCYIELLTTPDFSVYPKKSATVSIEDNFLRIQNYGHHSRNSQPSSLKDSKRNYRKKAKSGL